MAHSHAQLSVAPATEPVTLTEAKAHLRVTDTSDDTYITALIGAAREYVEDFTGRALIAQTWTYIADGFPYGDDMIVLPRPPLQSVTSVVYVDTAGANQTWAASNYTVDTTDSPGGIYLAYGASWPATRDIRHAVTITYVAGYVNTTTSPISGIVPARLKQAILLMVGHLYQNREPVNIGNIVTEIPLSVDALLMPFRVNYL